MFDGQANKGKPKPLATPNSNDEDEEDLEASVIGLKCPSVVNSL